MISGIQNFSNKYYGSIQNANNCLHKNQNKMYANIQADTLCFTNKFRHTNDCKIVEIKNNKTGELEKAEAAFKDRYGDETILDIKIGEKLIGTAKIRDVRISSNSYHNLADYGREDANNKMFGYIFIDYMGNKSKGEYSNVGTSILDLVRERSQELGYGGKMALDAEMNSHCFHWDYGFRPLYQRHNDSLEKYYTQYKNSGEHVDTSKLDEVRMIMPCSTLLENANKRAPLKVIEKKPANEDSKETANKIIHAENFFTNILNKLLNKIG